MTQVTSATRTGMAMDEFIRQYEQEGPFELILRRTNRHVPLRRQGILKSRPVSWRVSLSICRQKNWA